MNVEFSYELIVGVLVLTAAAWSVAARDSYSATVGFVKGAALGQDEPTEPDEDP